MEPNGVSAISSSQWLKPLISAAGNLFIRLRRLRRDRFRLRTMLRQARFTAPIASLFLASLASGQTAPSTSGTQLLTPVTVEALAPNNILPTSTDFSDAFGLDLPVTDIPRS